jgi:hypothetical protein
MWWLARKSLEPHFEMLFNRAGSFDCIPATLTIENTSRATLFIDQIYPYSPIGLKVSLPHSSYDASIGEPSLRPEWADTVPGPPAVPPGKSSSTTILLRLPEDLRFSTIVSISVRILRKSRTMPYRIKVVTAILPEYIKKVHD